MAIVVQSVGVSPGADSNQCVITAPTGIAVGDYLVALICVERAGTTITPASGFTAVVTNIQESGTILVGYSKVADAGDAAAGSFTFGFNGVRTNVGGMLRISGQTTVSPVNTSSQGIVGSPSTTVLIDAMTPSVANCLIIECGGLHNAQMTFSGYTMVNDSPSFTERFDFSTALGNAACIACATGTRPQTTSTGEMSITASASNTTPGIAIAIAPAADTTNIFMGCAF